MVSIELKHDLIKTEEESAFAEQKLHSVLTEDAASAEKDVTMEEKTLEPNFRMTEEVCIS